MIFQLGSALLDACVLAVLSEEDAYGYSLTQRVKSVLDISESTLYPVLRRLQRKSTWLPTISPFRGGIAAITPLRKAEGPSWKNTGESGIFTRKK